MYVCVVIVIDCLSACLAVLLSIYCRRDEVQRFYWLEIAVHMSQAGTEIGLPLTAVTEAAA